MHIHYSKAFRNSVISLRQIDQHDHHYTDHIGLLAQLEAFFGLNAYLSNTEFLRIELYRQSLNAYAETHPTAFYKASYEIDRFATATVCLEHRDTLLLSGFDFISPPSELSLPRLSDFCGVEQIFKQKIESRSQHREAYGFADRFVQVLLLLKESDAKPFDAVTLHDPQHLIPRHLTMLFERLAQMGVTLDEHKNPTISAKPGTDLHQLQSHLSQVKTGEKHKLKNDGSLIIVKAPHDLYASQWCAQWLRVNQALTPCIIAPKGASLLMQSMQMEGLPTSGVLSSSLARPSLQVLKLAPAFIWQPLDVYKLMEFVNLPIIPLDDQLASIISQVLAEKPGINSQLWFARVLDYLDTASPEIKAQYQFLFNRKRYDSDAFMPKREALELYQFIYQWASAGLAQEHSTEWQILSGQSHRICTLLEALPDERIGRLDLEHLIRTVYEATPVTIASEQLGAYPFSQEPGALTQQVPTVLWWNFVDTSTNLVADFWTALERQWLDNQSIHLDTPVKAAQLNKYHHQLPIALAEQKLILFLPDKIAGDDMIAHPLYVRMEASFDHLHACIYDLDNQDDLQRLAHLHTIPEESAIECRQVSEPMTFIETEKDLAPLGEEEEESFTTLENLLYYPHTWYFKKQLGLKNARILDIKKDSTLLGNLAHRFFEELLVSPSLAKMKALDVYQWIDNASEKIFEEEGATLLLYGREIEKQQFLQIVKRGIWVFVQMLQNNGWSVEKVEHAYKGLVLGVPVKCRTDVILWRGEERAIIDLKWGGAAARGDLIRNGEDIQLITYARAYGPIEYWPHTGFYIISDAKLLMRNRLAFDNAVVPGKISDRTHAELAQEIFERMEKTLAWRFQQLQEGKVEIRTAETYQALEDLYSDSLLDLLNLPSKSGRYDPYLTLVSGV
jgi:hypothetical protein